MEQPRPKAALSAALSASRVELESVVSHVPLDNGGARGHATGHQKLAVSNVATPIPQKSWSQMSQCPKTKSLSRLPHQSQ
jgi:hypothetical protein